MENLLPTDFDLVIVGTGITESILSAAASRIGKNILQLDRNDYYGGQWASFNLKSFHNFSPNKSIKDADSVNNGTVRIGNNLFDIKNFETKWYIPEKSQELANTEEKSKNLEVKDNLPSKSDGEKEDTAVIIKPKHIVFTQESLLKNSRKFNIDLVPKLHFARGKFVELLISSNIARYAEYRSVSRVLTMVNGQLEVVPCSRSDVFANNRVSVIEKRMLMKLLTSLDENNEDLSYEGLTFKQYLKEKKLTPNLIHHVLYAISRSTDETSCLEGVENTKRFLNSLGRFGRTPFLFSMYGSGETTQAFCRLSAVFGGIFALNQESLLGFKLEDNKVTTLINGDQEIKGTHFILSAENSPREFFDSMQVKDYIARAVFITNKSLMPSEQEHLTLLNYPPEQRKNNVTIVEMGALTGTCPKDLFLVHLTAKQVANPQEDFEPLIKNLFNTSSETESSYDKPQILWSCFFSLPDSSNLNLNANVPSNIFLCTGPDLDLDYDLSIQKARNIFEQLYPNLEFLPRAPDPEEIIIGGETEQSDS